METFPFVNHVPTHSYPKGTSFKFGGGYEHSAAPQDPLQRRFTLKFAALIWYKNALNQYDATIDVENNALAFDNFYRAHRTHKKFIYNHPVFGAVTCKFAADMPFDMPTSIEGSGGVTEGFEIVLLEQPL